MSALAGLEARFKRIADIEGALAVLHWDQAVTMPKGGNAARGEQMATLQGLIHDILTDPETADLLSQAEAAAADLEAWPAANLREMRRICSRATALDSRLVQALARATNEAEMVWREARQASDFPRLEPYLAEVLNLTREAAEAYGAALDLAPYDALLDRFQPGLCCARITPLFDEIAGRLPAMIETAISRQTAPLEPKGPFPVDKQRQLARELMGQLGFDFDHGRLDESTHPFCGGTPTDIRITTRYDENDVVEGIMGVLHETGHALYEAGLPEAWRHQPVGEARGMVVHESQSLLIEMQACRSPAFLRHLATRLEAAFGADPAFASDNLARRYSRVERGPIRVEADELTYPLHIILRYRLEQTLLSGDLALADLPAAWNDGMAELLGLRPENDRKGCLQDIHWPVGAFGYFPAYTLGAILAAQLFRSAERAIPELLDSIARGDFTPLLGWLRSHIHERASFHDLDPLIHEATGETLTTQPYFAHLETRYLT